MKAIVILMSALMCAGALADEGEMREVRKLIPIVRYLGSLEESGAYSFDTEGGDGTKFQEKGELKHIAGDGDVSVKSGSVSWTSPEGLPFTLTYTSDENGFHPVGSHLPKSPPVPPEILKVLPLLPKLDELEAQERSRVREESHVEERPMVAPVQQSIRINQGPPSPMNVEPMNVNTADFSIDHSSGRTSVRIGH